MLLQNEFTKKLGIQYPIICGAMYPCSNPELVAAVSEAGGIGIIQPISLTYVYKYDYREGLKKIREITKKPVGVNVLVEKSSEIYLKRMMTYVDQSLEAGVRFFITALGNPRAVVDKVHAAGGIVFHDVTEKKWAMKALEHGVDGLICVNRLAGGHAGTRTPEELLAELKDLNVPLVCAGGVGSPEEFTRMLKMGYLGVQMGTRFIAAKECKASDDYKKAILSAKASDIVLTEKLTGVPVAVINTPTVKRMGTKAGPIARLLLKHHKTKHWMRMYYTLKSVHSLKKSIQKPMSYTDFYQAGKSVESIDKIESASDIVSHFVDGVA